LPLPPLEEDWSFLYIMMFASMPLTVCCVSRYCPGGCKDDIKSNDPAVRERITRERQRAQKDAAQRWKDDCNCILDCTGGCVSCVRWYVFRAGPWAPPRTGYPAWNWHGMEIVDQQQLASRDAANSNPSDCRPPARMIREYAADQSGGNAQVSAACAPNPSSSGSSVPVVKAKVVWQRAPFDSAGPTGPMGTVVQATTVPDVPFKGAPPAYGQQGGGPMGTVVQATTVPDVPFKGAPPAYGQQGGVVLTKPVPYMSNV